MLNSVKIDLVCYNYRTLLKAAALSKTQERLQEQTRYYPKVPPTKHNELWDSSSKIRELAYRSMRELRLSLKEKTLRRDARLCLHPLKKR